MARSIRGRGERPPGAAGAIRAAVVLLVPFAVMVVLLRGLSVTLPVFHGTDELFYHLPLIRAFAQGITIARLQDYLSGSGPLYYIVMAGVAILTGGSLVALRLANVLVSYICALAAYIYLSRRMPGRDTLALGLALVVTLSPYVFSASFILLTDNLALLFVILCLASVDRYAERWRGGPVLSAALALCAATLTRQPSLYLLAPMIVGLSIARGTHRQTAASIALFCAAIAPLLALIVLWGGLVPPSAQAVHTPVVAVNLRIVLFGVAVWGLYSLAMTPWRTLADWVRIRRRFVYESLAACVGGLLMLGMVPLAVKANDDGYLWQLAAALPTAAGSNILFVFLVPVGIFTLYRLLVVDRRWIELAAVAGLLASVAANQLTFQKYVDPMTILLIGAVAWASPSGLFGPSAPAPQWQDWIRLAALGLTFIAYLAVKAAGLFAT